jgi:spore coat protein U-like protein
MKYTSALHSVARATLLGFLALGLTTTSAFAATTTTTFNVTANVGNTCSITTTPLAFLTVVPTTTTVTNATSNINVTCSSGDVYTVGLGAGNGTGATETSRFMMSAANKLAYALFNDAGYSVNWGQTTGGQMSNTGNGAAQQLTVYGQISKQTAPANGNYSDIITVTVTY